ncbi:MAG: methionyl-tRNA formyltransferase [Planctomycetota bacterium]
MKVVFLGSPPFATPIFDALLASERHDVLGLVTPPDRPRGRGRSVVRSELAQRADEAGVPVVQPASTKDPAFVETLGAFGADCLAVASYGEILRRDVLELCPHGALNVHASLLPRWRGASPIQRAIRAGDAVTGVSIQRMVLALDAGDVILSRETPIGPTETAADLFGRLSALGAEALLAALDALEDGTATFTPQDDERVTLAPKLTKADGVLDPTLPADELERHVRAMTTWPGARLALDDDRALVVLEADVVPGTEGAAPGTLVDAERFVLATGDGTALRLVRVKPAGKGAMDGAAFLRGARLQEGWRAG